MAVSFEQAYGATAADKKKKGEYISFNAENIINEEVGVWTYSDDRTINGGKFYNEVFPSKVENETVSPNLKPLTGNCSI